MSKKYKALLLVAIVGGLAVVLAILISKASPGVLSPQGIIAEKQRNLIALTTFMSLIIVIPVFAMTFIFAWKYRESNTKAKYSPDWDHSVLAETIWWTVPLIMILVLAGITWKTSHSLDPFRSVKSTNPPMTIQVVALDWKWLFIYPQQRIASVNYVQFPEKTPVKFEITADAPMNSFWIPQLGGQIYAMSGMSTHLNLMASTTGTFRGSSANISGRGFAGMNFKAKSTTTTNFYEWANKVQASPNQLNMQAYENLSMPSQNNMPIVFSNVDPHLYDTIVMKYMTPLTAGKAADAETL